MNSRRRIPLATYRLQLNRDFTFAQATAIVPYLSALGISHCYVSPCLKARAGSVHGYDIVDHSSLNPELGTTQDFDRLVDTLHQHGMGLILDIVPNHMGIMGSDNAWWLDVLENGESSLYASFFDIDWHPIKEELHGKVLIPALADHYGAVLESGDLKLAFREDRGEFDICYHSHRFPIDPKEYPRILRPSSEIVAARLGAENPDVIEFQSLITAFSHLPGRYEFNDARRAERNRDKEIHKRRLAELCQRSPEIVASIATTTNAINGNPADPASFEELHELIKAQTFRLANWRVASDDINYRRFFDTNDLAGISVENEAVFEATHQLVLALVSQGKVDGLRIDHPDGLYDPKQYLERLHSRIVSASDSPADPYVVIEKILTGSERLSTEWPIAGTTGYDFSNLVNGLFIDTAARSRIDRIYSNFVGYRSDVSEIAYRCRKLIVRLALVSELNVLATRLTRIALAKRRTCDFTLNNLRDILTEVVANFPVYRTYVSPAGVSATDDGYIRAAIAAAKLESPADDPSVFDFVEKVLLTSIAKDQDQPYRQSVTAFAMKFQQFTSPVMAKGLEDTAFYRYNRLVSLNDVGSELHRFGTNAAEFHRANRLRLRSWPRTMLATSTHDSKRSEDVRARINVLSEMAGPWRLSLKKWSSFNLQFKSVVRDEPAPSRNDEYLIYQTLIGIWPAQGTMSPGESECIRERLDNYMLKAMREAKENTSWVNRNAQYEEAVSKFIRSILVQDSENPFLNDFEAFQQRVSRLGVWNSLSQTLLKLSSPGIPDIYQGNEIWDFSLVDPDNRRAVDYIRRRKALQTMNELQNPSFTDIANDLTKKPGDGRIKMFLIWKALSVRQQHPDLFDKGEYLQLTVRGKKASHAVAFARRQAATTLVIVVPRLVGKLLDGMDDPPTGKTVWGDTNVLLPFPSKQFRNAFTDERLDPRATGNTSEFAMSEALATFPVALFVSQ